MMGHYDPRTVGAQIRMKLPFLTPLEARVVDTITGRNDLDLTTALRQVSEDAGVSDAMVVKIAKKLGFNGFRDFREALVVYRQTDVASLHSEISPEDSSADIIRKVFQTSIQALEETMSIIDVSAFDRAATLLHGARQRDFYGVGGSAQIARDVAHKFLRIGLRAGVQDDPHMMLMSAALLGPEDVVVAFSHSGTTSNVIEAARLARQQGARVIAITNYATAPLSELADIALCSTAQGSPLLGENAAARIAQLNIMDAIFVAVAQRDLERAEAQLARTRNAVDNKRRR
ncbi:MurR/RpiR family transcriptional regulator [Paracoccus denitrificans]|jgi:DNA-binding MurR/RpiR family transcriptional regulator|uniref:Transcriptional regulator, RpiR family n=1 Tax=Paracoccus denitrificans (strain Pd 1222) TaxID=318586 RepID=A1AYM0_PARDP|nr:MurR/RpiR family transcriptional regulator [Paracoccus denitrificans]ABL68364.1 transcriptional regulator, RpiR family [Paracoccus denitrificans PD1222]MBB4627880.1 DNA-binding MurR/RpiR family transcriptional regulator [Paracoccus denitrificans]MCU7428585.1 MurR/RpiR family transcriptional regulator [Paracoccus denitrificans]UPV95382.1 MurR/RpiR family transcriptional regulator [Paracoccus denitrificans]WQO32559.1 MurR/RpiR family transcriptional regulator [Paracoccus denitrificans]